jgi:hypothetical protein
MRIDIASGWCIVTRKYPRDSTVSHHTGTDMASKALASRLARGRVVVWVIFGHCFARTHVFSAHLRHDDIEPCQPCSTDRMQIPPNGLQRCCCLEKWVSVRSTLHIDGKTHGFASSALLRLTVLH